MPPSRSTAAGFFTLPLVAALLAGRASAQTDASVEGRIFDRISGTSVSNAIVTLEGHGSTLSSENGSFRFERVEVGAYTLRVDAFGYADESRPLAVEGPTTVSVPLDAAPLALDSLVVEPRLVDVGGRIRDPTRDLYLVDAEILTNQVAPTYSGAHGRFSLGDVFEDVPLRVVVQAFGYLPLDTLVLPSEHDDYLFHLRPDSLVERLIDEQVSRLEERASPRHSMVMRPMDRERLLGYAGRHTVASMLEWEYGRRLLRRVKCVLINEEQLLGEWRPSTLFHFLPEDVERIEFLFDGAMLRIYTREFIRQMVTSEVALRTPSFFSRPRVDPLCV